MSQASSLIATMRFGLGPKPGEIETAAIDPRGYVLGMIEEPEAALVRPPVEDAGLEAAICLDERKDLKARQVADIKSGMASMSTKKQPLGRCFQAGYAREVAARVAHASATDAPFVERLVQFWSNHFAVSAAKAGPAKILAGDYERRAIRPHVLGRFRDMLGAISKHPAMLMYLNNHQSIGPNSKAGRRKERGINENFARELLELHTLGADGGYSQADVTNLARILTGWSVTARSNENPYSFTFSAGRHEPGAWEVLGASYEEDGVAQGEAVLDVLASHPSTAHHIARKMSRHFVSENPPESLVQRIADTFLDTEGDLAALAGTLVDSDEAWSSPLVKVLPPYDFMISSLRVTGVRLDGVAVVATMKHLGQPVWMPPSPEGWPDEDGAWLLPDALLERLDWAERTAKAAPDPGDVEAFGKSVLGDALQPVLSESLARAESREQALALLLMSPQLQRR